MSQTDPTRKDVHASQIDAEVERELAEALGGKSVEQLMDESSKPALSESSDALDREGGHPDDGATPKGDAQRFEMEIKRGRITSISGDDVFIELAGIDGKNQGVVSLQQFERPPRLGSIMDFVVQRYDEAEGLVHLSREGAVTRATWDTLHKGAVVEARVVSTNKGGLELEMVGSIRAFMPASQVDLHHTNDLEQYVGQKVHAVVQEIDRKGKKVVLSRRTHLEQDRAQKRKILWQELETGQTREGTVTSLMDYGVFVDIGGVDGLVHISDMSYKHVAKPTDLVKVGDKVSVKVLKLDREKERISLGLKQVAPDPWDGISERIKTGEHVSGRVMRTADFGAFIEIEPGVEGLLPASETSWKRNAKPSDMVKEGDVLRLVVLQVDPAKRRISLSLKQSQGDPWVGAERKFAKHALVDATVLSTTDFGAFVELEPGVEGLVHISELTDKRVGAVTDILQKGQKHQFRVLDVDEENRRIRLSLKAVKEPPPVETSSAAPAAKPNAATGKPSKKQIDKPGKGGLGSSGALGQGLGSLRL